MGRMLANKYIFYENKYGKIERKIKTALCTTYTDIIMYATKN